MNDWLNGKSRDEEQIRDDTDKDTRDCLYKGTPRKVWTADARTIQSYY